MTYIEALEKAMGKVAIKNMIDIQPGDVPATNADSSALEDYIDFKPKTSVGNGIEIFVEWYLSNYIATRKG